MHSLTLHDTSLTIILLSINHQSTQYSLHLLPYRYVAEVIRLLKPTGRFICISRMSPEEVLPLLEQFDIDEPFYTPWLIEVQATLKPKEYVLPSSLYRMGGNYNPQYPHPGGNENPLLLFISCC